MPPDERGRGKRQAPLEEQTRWLSNKQMGVVGGSHGFWMMFNGYELILDGFYSVKTNKKLSFQRKLYWISSRKIKIIYCFDQKK